jgi:hypothetical protein
VRVDGFFLISYDKVRLVVRFLAQHELPAAFKEQVRVDGFFLISYMMRLCWSGLTGYGWLSGSWLSRNSLQSSWSR